MDLGRQPEKEQRWVDLGSEWQPIVCARINWQWGESLGDPRMGPGLIVWVLSGWVWVVLMSKGLFWVLA